MNARIFDPKNDEETTENDMDDVFSTIEIGQGTLRSDILRMWASVVAWTSEYLGVAEKFFCRLCVWKNF